MCFLIGLLAGDYFLHGRQFSVTGLDYSVYLHECLGDVESCFHAKILFF